MHRQIIFAATLWMLPQLCFAKDPAAETTSAIKSKIQADASAIVFPAASVIALERACGIYPTSEARISRELLVLSSGLFQDPALLGKKVEGELSRISWPDRECVETDLERQSTSYTKIFDRMLQNKTELQIRGEL